MKKTFIISALLMVAMAAMAQKPVITFEKTEHDFGQINEGDGKVSTQFEFRNDGMEPLVLSNVKASCGCTTPEWPRQPIEPGAVGHITVTYNPNGRPGRFTKTVTITSNATQSSSKVMIKGEVIPRSAKPVDKYPVKMGAVSLNTKNVKYDKIYKGQVKAREVLYANKTNEAVTIGLLYDNRFIDAQVSLTTVEPNQEGIITFVMNSANCNEWGDVVSGAYLVVNGKEEKTDEYKINITADVEEDFTKLSEEQLHAAPIVEIAKSIDLGTVKAGSQITYKTALKNLGSNPLEVRRLFNNTGNYFTANVQKKTVKGGKSTNLVFTVNTKATKEHGQQEVGTYSRQIELMTNDPKNPRVKINVLWKVE